jgi:hypothetical protein
VRAALAADAALRLYAEAVVGYCPTALFVAVRDRDGVAVLHSDPEREGQPLATSATFARFLERDPVSQLWALSRDQGILVAELPFSADGVEPFGSVVVAMSTLLLRKQLLGWPPSRG